MKCNVNGIKHILKNVFGMDHHVLIKYVQMHHFIQQKHYVLNLVEIIVQLMDQDV